MKKKTLVTGATGFIGRWLVLELINQGHTVITLMRNPDVQLPILKTWVTERGGNGDQILAVRGDLSEEKLGLTEYDLSCLSDLSYLFHLGAVMKWNLDITTAREVNVRPIKLLAELAGQSPNFERFVLMTGFMISNKKRQEKLGLSDTTQLTDSHWMSLYKRLGSYEASKFESHFKLLNQLKDTAIPYTVINPGAVIGHSVTGEINQYDSIVSMIHELYKGNLPAIPGSKKDWLPVIPVDFVAKFTAKIINYEQGKDQQYTLIDETTPDLASMMATLSNAFHTPIVKRRIPIKLLKAIAKMGLERFLPLPSEPLSFISCDKYDIDNTKFMTAKMGIAPPRFEEYVQNFTKYLITSSFLQGEINQ